MQFIATDVSEETWEIPETYMRPSINLPGDVSEICKSAVFCLYQTPRRCTWDASMPSGNTFSTSIIFLQSSLRRQLSITSFIHMSAVVVTWKSRIPLLTGFKIIKFKIETFNIFKCSTKELVNQFFRTAIHRQVIVVQVYKQEFVRTWSFPANRTVWWTFHEKHKKKMPNRGKFGGFLPRKT